MSDNKVCSVCGESNVCFVKGMCRKCYQKDYSKKYRKTHKSQVDLYSKNYRESHKTLLSIKHKKYSDDNKERLLDYDKKYHEVRPLFTFLGERHKLEYHGRPPEGYVWHHTCYDHNDPEANIVLMSRSSHMMGHRLLRNLGIEIPHINMEE